MQFKNVCTTSRELQYFLDDAEVSVVVAGQGYAEMMRPLARSAGAALLEVEWIGLCISLCTQSQHRHYVNMSEQHYGPSQCSHSSSAEFFPFSAGKLVLYKLSSNRRLPRQPVARMPLERQRP